MKAIYLAGGLFNISERERNTRLAKCLAKFGRKVILPQEEALNFFDGQIYDIQGVIEDCFKKAKDPDNVCVACLDGPDADSGTAFEVGAAVTATGRAVVYRTDFRTALEKEVGINGMFQVCGIEIIYLPCFATTFAEYDGFYQNLAQKIHEIVKKFY